MFNSQAQRNISIPIIIILLKHLRHPLQTNTALYKQIEAYSILACSATRLVSKLSSFPNLFADADLKSAPGGAPALALVC